MNNPIWTAGDDASMAPPNTADVSSAKEKKEAKYRLLYGGKIVDVLYHEWEVNYWLNRYKYTVEPVLRQS